MRCPRRNEMGVASRFPPAGLGDSDMRADGRCGYCGSISGDEFMRLAEAGVELGPTDKSYKVYLDIPDPEQGQLWLCGSSNSEVSPGESWVSADAARAQGLKPYDGDRWVLIGRRTATRHGKFYFQHLSDEQRTRFVALLNERKLKFNGGGFYVLPFFIVPAPDAGSEGRPDAGADPEAVR